MPRDAGINVTESTRAGPYSPALNAGASDSITTLLRYSIRDM
jgi:hypothetical protein